MAIDQYVNSPFTDSIYVAWTTNKRIYFARSADNGATFTTLPNPISGGFGEKEHGVSLAVAPNGRLYAVWAIYQGGRETGMGFNKSSNGGGSFGSPAQILNINGIYGYLSKCSDIDVNSFPSLAVDKNDTNKIYLGWADNQYGDPDILLSRSTTGGASWLPPVRVNNDPQGNGIDQWFPSVCVTENGGVSVVFYDSRCYSQNDSTELFLAYSSDGGQNFENVVISDTRFCPRQIQGARPGYQGDYIGVASRGSHIYPAWMDNRTGIYQAYFADIVIKSGTLTQNEIWSGNILVTGDVTIPSGKTLTVTSGTVVKFTSGKKLNINGTLFAVGTSSDSITFTSSQPNPNRGNWYGIKFNDSSVDASCRIEYARIEYAVYGIYCYKATPTIKNNLFRESQPYGAYIYMADPKLENNTFKDNYIGIYTYLSTPNFDFTKLHIKDNDFLSNDFYGLYLSRSSPTIANNNVIDGNGGTGLYCYYFSNPIVGKSTITDNSYDGIRCESQSYPNIYYNSYYQVGGCNTITDNLGNGVKATGSSYPALGDDPTSPGNNDLLGNSGYEVYNGNSSGTLLAEGNFWGNGASPGDSVYGSVDYTPWLSSSPACTPGFGAGKILASNPPDSSAYFNRMGTRFMAEGRYEEASEMFQFVIDHYAGTEDAKFAVAHIAMCFENMGKLEYVLSYLDGVATVNASRDIGTFCLALGAHYLERAEKYEDALRRIDELLKGNMDRDLLFQKACIYRYGLEDNASAEVVFSEFLSRYPDDDLSVIVRAEFELLGPSSLPRENHREEELTIKPSAFALSQNYPNPFNPETSIDYQLSQTSKVTLRVFNILGQAVRTLVDGEREAGQYTVYWDGRDEYGREVASGVYFYRLMAGQSIETKRMLLLR